jgi:hypothetical protein
LQRPEQQAEPTEHEPPTGVHVCTQPGAPLQSASAQSTMRSQSLSMPSLQFSLAGGQSAGQVHAVSSPLHT